MPNWVDLLVALIILRACYLGLGRGLISEPLHLLGVVSATALACNFHGVVALWLAPWWRGNPLALDFVVFVGLLCGGAFLLHLAVSKLIDLKVLGGAIHWFSRGIGLTLGAIRGFWLAGLALLILLALGVPYLTSSIQERSVMGPRLVRHVQTAIDWVADRYPGHLKREVLIPSIKLPLPRLPEELQPS